MRRIREPYTGKINGEERKEEKHEEKEKKKEEEDESLLLLGKKKAGKRLLQHTNICIQSLLRLSVYFLIKNITQ